MNKFLFRRGIKQRIVLLFLLVLGLLGGIAQAASSNVYSTTNTAPGGTASNGYQQSNYSFTLNGTAQGHILFKNGISIQPLRTATYDADGYIDGSMIFVAASSVLALSTDLRLGTTATISGTSLQVTGGSKSIVLSDDLVLSGQVMTLNSSLTIDGQGHKLVINASTALAPFTTSTSNVSLTLKDMTLVLNPATASAVITLFTGAGTTNRLILDNVKVVLGPNAGTLTQILPTILTASAAVIIRNDVQFYGSGKAIKIAATTLDAVTGFNIYIEKNSRLYVGPGLTFYWPTLNLALLAANFNAYKLGMADQTATFHLDGCTIDIDYSRTIVVTDFNSGLQLTKGTVVMENKVFLNNGTDGLTSGTQGTGTDMAYGFIFGDGTASNDVNVRLLGGAYVIVNGCLQYKHA